MMLYQMVIFQIVFYMTIYLMAVYSIAIALMGMVAGSVISFLCSKFLNNNYERLWLIPLLITISILYSIIDISIFHSINYFTFFISIFIVFMFAGLFLSHSFALYNSFFVYASNMIGSGLGVLCAIIFIPIFLEENSLLIAMALPLTGSIIFLKNQKRLKHLKIAFLLLCLAAISSFFLLNRDTKLFNFIRDSRPNNYSHESSMNTTGYKWIHSRSGVSGRIDLGISADNNQVDNSLGTITSLDHDGHKVLTTFINNRNLDGINNLTNEQSFPDVRLPSALYNDQTPSILIVGPAAHGITKAAKVLGKDRVTAVEINPATIKVMTEDLAEFSKFAYKGLDLHHSDIRSYLKQTDKKFDIITLLNTHNYYIGNDPIPDYPFTKEAIKEYFSHLNNQGIIVIEELKFLDTTTDTVKRELANFINVMKTQKIAQNPKKHIYIYSWRRSGFIPGQWFYQLLIKKSPFQQEETQKLDRWVTGLQSNVLSTQIIYSPTHTKKIKDSITTAFYENLKPITDNHPFNISDKTNKIRSTVNMLLFNLFLIGLGIIALPSIQFIRVANNFKWNWLFIFYFLLSGFSYMFFEIYMFQINQLYIGTVGMSLIISTATMLIMSGIGSLVVSKLTKDKQIILLGCIPVYIMVWMIINPILLDWELFWFKDQWCRAGTIFILLGPLCFLMGVPFASGLNVVKEKFGNIFANYMFAVNGVSASIGTIISLNISIQYGFKTILIISSASYLTIFLFSLVLIRQKPSASDRE